MFLFLELCRLYYLLSVSSSAEEREREGGRGVAAGEVGERVRYEIGGVGYPRDIDVIYQYFCSFKQCGRK